MVKPVPISNLRHANLFPNHLFASHLLPIVHPVVVTDFAIVAFALKMPERYFVAALF
ncbi:hypothetical protein D3C80_908330 [compost metagenome]